MSIHFVPDYTIGLLGAVIGVLGRLVLISVLDRRWQDRHCVFDTRTALRARVLQSASAWQGSDMPWLSRASSKPRRKASWNSASSRNRKHRFALSANHVSD